MLRKLWEEVTLGLLRPFLPTAAQIFSYLRHDNDDVSLSPLPLPLFPDDILLKICFYLIYSDIEKIFQLDPAPGRLRLEANPDLYSQLLRRDYPDERSETPSRDPQEAFRWQRTYRYTDRYTDRQKLFSHIALSDLQGLRRIPVTFYALRDFSHYALQSTSSHGELMDVILRIKHPEICDYIYQRVVKPFYADLEDIGVILTHIDEQHGYLLCWAIKLFQSPKVIREVAKPMDLYDLPFLNLLTLVVERGDVENTLFVLSQCKDVEPKDTKMERQFCIAYCQLLVKASLNGYAEVVRCLLMFQRERLGILLTHFLALTDYSSAALCAAASKGHTAVVSLFLENGVSVNYVSRLLRSYTPLLAAAENGHAETVSLLLERGANYLYTTPGDVTAAYLAAGAGHADVLRCLFAHERKWQPISRLNTLPNPERAPLLWVGAIRRSSLLAHTEVARTLLAHGASVMEGRHGQSPIQAAVQSGNATMLALFLRVADLSQIDLQDLLSMSIRSTQPNYPYCEIAQVLLSAKELLNKDKSADVNLRDRNHYYPIQVAVGAENNITNRRVVRLLLAHNADLSVLDMYGNSLLHLAVSHGATKIARMLLKKGANPNAKNYDGKTPLQVAIKGHYGCRHPQAIELLLKWGADPDAKNAEGKKPGDTVYRMTSSCALFSNHAVPEKSAASEESMQMKRDRFKS